jgi:predicted nucleotidyltransferase
MAAAGSRDAAYRRLAAVLLGLDVASLATELRQRRLAVEPIAA